jgi:hypothetical protein
MSPDGHRVDAFEITAEEFAQTVDGLTPFNR